MYPKFIRVFLTYTCKFSRRDQTFARQIKFVTSGPEIAAINRPNYIITLNNSTIIK